MWARTDLDMATVATARRELSSLLTTTGDTAPSWCTWVRSASSTSVGSVCWSRWPHSSGRGAVRWPWSLLRTACGRWSGSASWGPSSRFSARPATPRRGRVPTGRATGDGGHGIRRRARGPPPRLRAPRAAVRRARRAGRRSSAPGPAARRADLRLPAGGAAHRPPVRLPRRTGRRPGAGRERGADPGRRPVRGGPGRRLPVVRGADDHRGDPALSPRPVDGDPRATPAAGSAGHDLRRRRRARPAAGARAAAQRDRGGAAGRRRARPPGPRRAGRRTLLLARRACRRRGGPARRPHAVRRGASGGSSHGST